MPRTITVTGIGRVTARPDTVIISMTKESQDKDYDRAMQIEGDGIADIVHYLTEAKFHKDMIKTTDFNVRTEYENLKDRSGNYRRAFKYYVVSQKLILEFPIDTKQLSLALTAISKSQTYPQLSISFAVKDATAINEEMLRSATANAKRKAEVLCDAAGVKLGDLVSINYSWGDLNIYSDTNYDLAKDCLADPMTVRAIDIEPDDIDIRDTATFVWEIE